MSFPGTILIVDDDAAVRQSLCQFLTGEGYWAEAVSTRDAALHDIDDSRWDVVLVDQKLLGPGGSSEPGLSLIGEIQRRSPGTRSILITGYADAASVRRAFDEGAYDYLEKGSVFLDLLLIKVRNAVDSRLARLRLGQEAAVREVRLKEAWASALSEPDPNRKGRFLEEVMELLLASIPGFQVIEANLRNQHEELDLFVRNQSRDPFWQREGSYILVECKNWTKPVGRREFDVFQSKLRRRFNRARLGLFIAMNGFTTPFQNEQRTNSSGDALIIPISGEQLARWIGSSDRRRWLEAAHAKAVNLREV